MKKISEIFLKTDKKTLSFEFFPPRTATGFKNLYEKVAPVLASLKPDFFSVTCGAEGKDMHITEEVARQLQSMFPDISVMQHISIMAVSSDEDEMSLYLDRIKSAAMIKNILALRGDIHPNKKISETSKSNDALRYSSDLCHLIKERYGGYFSVGVAAYPDGHPECDSIEECNDILKTKFDSGADFAITQFFFETNKYVSMLTDLESLGVNTRIKHIIPGVLPILDFDRLVSFASKCEVKIPQEVREYFKDSINDKQSMIQKGIEYAYRQSVELLNSGAPGIHIFTLNQEKAPFEVVSRLRSEGLLI